MATGRDAVNLEMAIQRKNDLPIPVRITTSVIKDKEGKVIGGMESLFGAALGAMLCRITLELLREINILGLRIELGTWRYAVFGLLLIFTLRFSQNGLIFPIIDRLFLNPARKATVDNRRPDNKRGKNDQA